MIKPRLLLLRDDDADVLDPPFRATFESCLAARLPVTYAAIPGRLAEDFVDFLRTHPARGELFETAQHGWVHADHNGGNIRPRYEFGPMRTYAAQRADMARGLKTMKAAFGPLFNSTFVPPFHFYDAATLKAATSLGLRMFSAGEPRHPMPPGGPLYVRAALSVNEYVGPGRPRPLSLPRLVRETAALIEREEVIVPYFHHAAFGARDLKVFAGYLRFLRKLVDAGWLTPLNFSAYAAAAETRRLSATSRAARRASTKHSSMSK